MQGAAAQNLRESLGLTVADYKDTATLRVFVSERGKIRSRHVTVRNASALQNNQRDRVIAMTMQWRLGYHRTPITTKQLPHAYGHFGVGGPGAWADPEHDLALAMVCNRGTGRRSVICGSCVSARPPPEPSSPSPRS